MTSPAVDLEWGARGLEALATRRRHIVIVDVLSFTTCVEQALARGARVRPWPLDRPVEEAGDPGLRVARRRREAGPEDLSLSPASMARLRPRETVLLPSPNGSALSSALGDRPDVWAACLRNASAVAARLAALGGSVGLVPAGERWEDGSLRPAVEDLLGAGAVASALGGRASPEAQAAIDAFRSALPRLGEALRGSVSGRELADAGYEADVAVAAAHDVSGLVPGLLDGVWQAVRFRAGSAPAPRRA